MQIDLDSPTPRSMLCLLQRLSPMRKRASPQQQVLLLSIAFLYLVLYGWYFSCVSASYLACPHHGCSDCKPPQHCLLHACYAWPGVAGQKERVCARKPDAATPPRAGLSPSRWQMWGRGRAGGSPGSAAADTCSPLRDGAAAHAECARTGDAANEGRRRLPLNLWMRK